MADRPWYITSQQWEQRNPTPTAPNLYGYDQRLDGILRLPSETEKQTALLTELVREVHTMKLILWWVLIIVPVIVIVLGIVVAVAAHQTPVTSTSGYGY